jgi:hypothetical protein
LEGSDHGVIEVLTWNLDAGTENSYQKALRIFWVLGKIKPGNHHHHTPMHTTLTPPKKLKHYQFSQPAQW